MDQRDAVQVLAVDDDPAFVDMLGQILESEDGRLSVATATSASDGLRSLSEHEFDCVVSDFEMPEMDGVEFLRVVRQRWGALPFIMFTAHGDEEVASEAISAGVTDYLQKEFGMDQYAVLVGLIRDSVS